MPPPFRRSLPLAGAVLALAALARAQSAAIDTPTRVRAVAPEARALLDELVDRSPTAHALVDRLEQSDVIVYVRFRSFTTELFHGRTGLLPTTRRRFLVVELACAQSHIVELTTLAHELYHAVEIADAPSVVDAATLSAHYSRIGSRVGKLGDSELFETNAAANFGRQVRRELLAGAVRTTQ